jgi:hypothetical protein
MFVSEIRMGVEWCLSVRFPQQNPLCSSSQTHTLHACMGKRRGAYIYIYIYIYTYLKHYYCYFTLYLLQNVSVTVKSLSGDKAVRVYMNITESNYSCRYTHHTVAKYTDLYYLNGSRP